MPLIPDDETACADTRRWLERAVIGLNLCPFARGVSVKGQIHMAVARGSDPEVLVQALASELRALQNLNADIRDTTLLILPDAWPDFLDFNDFLDRADATLAELGLEGVLQIASFHPRFQFADTEPDDIGNCTNRSPYPTLHLLREESIDRAVEAFPQAETIYEANIATLEKLGRQGWDALQVGPSVT
ncbi:MAG TPA: DUF1415 domain-containing protein [Burkholderiaceae bacterium]|nr:DUF1415 domain-containing protein [Burkholderiaceae bacterium]